MSNNKYIIDEDSLTGIADAIRDKLGVGEATTDSQTGDIIYPEDKGYYLKEEVVTKISGFGWSKTGYSGSFTQGYAPLINGTDWDEAVGEPWYSVEITLINVGGNNRYNMDVYYSGNNMQTFTNVTSSTYTVSAPNGSTYFNLYFGNTYSSSVWNGSSSLGSLIVIFKDAEGKPIKPKQSSIRYLWSLSRIQGTVNFGTVDVETPIPLTIDDIQDKITNYLNPAQEVLQPTNAEKSITNTYSLDVTNLFSSTEDLLDRMQQVIAQNGSSVAYLRCGADGRPLSMKEQGISLPNGISSYNGGWNMNDVRAGYDNGLTFKFNFAASYFNQLNRWLWIYNNDNARRILVLCQDTDVGVPLNNGGTMFCFYKGA